MRLSAVCASRVGKALAAPLAKDSSTSRASGVLIFSNTSMGLQRVPHRLARGKDAIAGAQRHGGENEKVIIGTVK